jgi:predicted S18 family serine protease
MEKLTELEARQKRFERDYAHEVTIFKGVIGAQGIDTKEIKIDVQDISQRLGSVQEDIVSLKKAMGYVKEDVVILREDIISSKTDIGDMKTDIKQILTFLTPGKSEL